MDTRTKNSFKNLHLIWLNPGIETRQKPGDTR